MLKRLLLRVPCMGMRQTPSIQDILLAVATTAEKMGKEGQHIEGVDIPVLKSGILPNTSDIEIVILYV
jgi:hypothetical protein